MKKTGLFLLFCFALLLTGCGEKKAAVNITDVAKGMNSNYVVASDKIMGEWQAMMDGVWKAKGKNPAAYKEVAEKTKPFLSKLVALSNKLKDEKATGTDLKNKATRIFAAQQARLQTVSTDYAKAADAAAESAIAKKLGEMTKQEKKARYDFDNEYSKITTGQALPPFKG